LKFVIEGAFDDAQGVQEFVWESNVRERVGSHAVKLLWRSSEAGVKRKGDAARAQCAIDA